MTRAIKLFCSRTSRMAVFFSLLFVGLSWMSAASAQQYKQLTALGTSEAMCSGGVDSVAELQQFVTENPNAFAEVIRDSGASLDPADVTAVVMSGRVVEEAFVVGSKFAWMGAKKQGVYVAKPYREWAGTQSMEAFSIKVESGCQIYKLAIPKQCCNLSLVGVVASMSPSCVAPKEEVASQVVEPAPAPAPRSQWVKFIGGFVGTETRPRYETAWDMDMRDSSGIVGINAGIMKHLSEKDSMFARLSFYRRNGINVGNVYPDRNAALDIGLERKLSDKAFIGAGMGLWNIDDGDYRDGTIFGHVGGQMGSTNWQWLLEARGFDSDSKHLDGLSNNRMFSFGVRYIVK